MAGAYGPCRLGKYAVEAGPVPERARHRLPDTDHRLQQRLPRLHIGPGFERLAWKGIVAVDHLEKLLWRTRPYEKVPGICRGLFNECLAGTGRPRRASQPDRRLPETGDTRVQAAYRPRKPRRPLVGINGEIFLRSNTFSNSNLVKECENAGLEVVVSPIGEWINYITYRNLEDGIRDRDLKKTIMSYLRQWQQRRDERSVTVNFEEVIDTAEPRAEGTPRDIAEAPVAEVRQRGRPQHREPASSGWRIRTSPASYPSCRTAACPEASWPPCPRSSARSTEAVDQPDLRRLHGDQQPGEAEQLRRDHPLLQQGRRLAAAARARLRPVRSTQS